MNTQSLSIPCAACGRSNLPGGVRCIYCGAHFPPALDFDLGTPAAASKTSLPPASAPQGRPGKAAGAVGSLALLLMKAKSLFALFKIGKIALTFSTMLISIAAYAQIYRWRFAVGLVICIFIHELGHVFVNWRKGIRQTAPMFIPFLGAVIFVKQFPNEPTIESESGAGGPAAGALAAFACLLMGHATGNPFWYALASIGFLINLFNLAPFGQLDGAHIASVFSPQVWNGVLFAVLLVALKTPFYALWVVLGANLLARLSHSPGERYLLAAPLTRIRMAAIYALLCIGLSWGIQQTGAYIGTESKIGATQAVARRSEATSIQQPKPPLDRAQAPNTSPAHPLPQRRPLFTSEFKAHVLRVFGWFLLFGAGGLSLLTPYLLAVAANRPLRPLALLPPLLLLAGFSALYSAPSPLAATVNTLSLLGAYFTASAAALGYAAHQAYRLTANGGKRTRPPTVALMARCLAWAGGGALIAAYATNNLITAAIVALLALGFYARYRWMPICVAANLAESLGDHARALGLLHRAVSRQPDADSLAQIWLRIARINLTNDRGAATLAAIEARQSALTPQDQNSLPQMPAALSDLEGRAAALMLLDRFDESLTCCEQMLQAGPDDKAGALRLLAVHIRLSRIAHFRGWEDEATAQADWCIRVAAKLPRPLMARLQVGRAQSLAAQGSAEAARQSCKQALAASREPYIQAMTGLVEAELCLRERNAEAAEKAASRALRLLPDNLQCRCWHARALTALGRAEGREALRDLAANFAQEHWGREASGSLAAIV